MKLNKEGIDLMHEFEGLRLEAYLCPAKIPTIGWGNTYYESGRGVQMGDVITRDRADKLFQWVADSFAIRVRSLVKVQLNENQFSALVSFAYNLGVSSLSNSTLLKKVNINPNDPTIFNEFLRWNKAGGKVLTGLTRRRQAEGNLYFKPITK
jgi:lysozyme